MLKKILIFSLLLAVIIVLGNRPVYSSDQLLSGFEDTSSWTLQNLRGDTQGSRIILSPDAIHGKSSLRVEFKAGSPGVDEVALARRGRFDLSRAERLEFWVKGAGQGDRFFLRLEDASGRGKSYRFTPDYLLYDIFSPRWRRITIKPDISSLDWAKITEIAFVVNDSDSPRQAHTTTLNIDALIAARGRPTLKLNYPQEFTHKKNGRLDILLISAGITPAKERWNLEEILNKHFKGVNIEKVRYEYNPWRYKGKLEGSPPAFHKDLVKYDLIILQNWDTDALDKVYQSMLKDYVQGGGAILILGGYYSFGAAKLKNTILGDVLPFSTRGYFDLREASSRTIKVKEGSFLEGVFKNSGPAVFWYHSVKPKPGAEVQVAGEDGKPLVITWPWGKGRVAAIAMTVLGSKEMLSGYSPFWESEGYEDFLTRVITRLTGGAL